MDYESSKTRIENFRVWYEGMKTKYDKAANFVLERILAYLK